MKRTQPKKAYSFKVAVTTLLLFALLSSCVVSKTTYGDYDQQKGMSHVMEKNKDIYLFWNQVKIRDGVEVTDYESYERLVKRNVFDAVVFYGTAGILSMYTVKIKTKQADDSD